MKRVPWLTIGFATLALVIYWVPTLTSGLQFEREAIAQGQVWRLLTAHLTHFGRDHLQWDLVAFVVLGFMAERISRREFLATLGLAAVVVAVGVGLAQPQFTIYRGLSGLDSALYGFVIADLLAAGWRVRHGFSIAVGGLALAGFAAKCGFEMATGATFFVDSSTAFIPVPLAHLLGLVTGAGVRCLSKDFSGKRRVGRVRAGGIAGVRAGRW